MAKMMRVWTNGKSIRKYSGQDKNSAVVKTTEEKDGLKEWQY